MISYLSGRIILSRPGLAIIDVGGIGYRVATCPNLKLNQGQSTALFLHHHFRESGQELYAFKSFDELEMFEKLISVNGVGPKVGLAIMSIGDPAAIGRAIADGDARLFLAIPGIGKKVAGKIILELKNKISSTEASELVDLLDEADEVAEALLNLGYKKTEVAVVLQKAPTEIKDSAEKVRWCLKNLSKG